MHIGNLKTHFGLHNPLMTLSSLEIRNSWCLMHVLQVGACGGVTEYVSEKFGIIKLAGLFYSPFFSQRNVFYCSSVFRQLYLKESMCHLIDAI